MLVPQCQSQRVDQPGAVAQRGQPRAGGFEVPPNPVELLPVEAAQRKIRSLVSAVVPGDGQIARLRRGAHNAVSPRSSLRMRMASSMRDRKILPSPILPVRAALVIACTA